MYRPEPFLKLRFCESFAEKFRLPEQLNVIRANLLGVKLYFHMPIPVVPSF